MKVITSLDGIWKLNWFEFGHSEGQFKKDYNDSSWLNTKVPGEVHETLLKYNLIKDPYFGKNCDEREWVERVDWWYRRKFFIPKEYKGKRIEILFEGLDTFATIWVNGIKVASSEDMFLPLRIDVSKALNYNDWNTIAVRLGAPWYETIRRAGEFSEKNLLWNGSYARLYARKAQYQYGWDWAVKLLTVGIWRSVKLIAYDKAVIRNLYARTISIGKDSADIEIRVEVYSLGEYNAKIRIEGSCKGSNFFYELNRRIVKGLNEFSARIKIKNPMLWWPHGYGEQNLYEIKAGLSIDGKLEDNYKTSFGIRTVELIKDSNETENKKVFYFKINGVKIFAKGADWIPADLLISRLNKKRYEDLLNLVISGNHNMLRVWGGGLVEYDDFYELCDKLGIMIWHDFQFACGHYPEDKNFLNLIKEEVEATVKRLRNHPSIVLWCGNNEDEMFDFFSGYGITKPKIDFEIIPEIVRKNDPSRPYWPSSPWGGESPNDPREGDRHNWDVYHGLMPIESYTKDEARFLSEFGMQAVPSYKSIIKFIPEGKLWPISEYWLYHYHVPEKVVPYLSEFGKPINLFSYIYLTQLLQAEALRTAIEHCRRRKFKCGGVMYWSFNAPWPNMCWEVIDYYGRPKIAFYFIKRAFEPVIVSPLVVNKSIEVWVINDKLKDFNGNLRALVIRDDKILEILSKNVHVDSNSSKLVDKIDISSLKIKGLRPAFIVFKLNNSRNVLFLDKRVDLSSTDLSVNIVKVFRDGKDILINLKVSSSKYARLVYLDVLEDYITIADDNFFDLMPKEEKLVTLRVKDVRERELTLFMRAFNSKERRVKVTYSD